MFVHFLFPLILHYCLQRYSDSDGGRTQVTDSALGLRGGFGFTPAVEHMLNQMDKQMREARHVYSFSGVHYVADRSLNSYLKSFGPTLFEFNSPYIKYQAFRYFHLRNRTYGFGQVTGVPLWGNWARTEYYCWALLLAR